MNAENLITGNARVVRSINRALIINLIRTRQPISRIEIARHTGLNKSTVSSIVSDLIQEELICEKVNTDQAVGRSPVDLYLKKGRYLTGAINIDRVSTRFAIVDIYGSVLASSSIITDPVKPKAFIQRCLKEIDELCELYSIEKLEGLGISIAGIVDSAKSIVTFAPNLGWENVDIGEIIRKLRPDTKILAVGNDAKASALAEQWFGTHERALHDFVFVAIGTGIGTGIIVENKLLEGEFNASGEFGHISILDNGKECSCGNGGCWERYASERAIVERYMERKTEAAALHKQMAVEDVIDRAFNDEPEALEVMRETGTFLGLGLTNIILALDPQTIVLGGKITKAWDLIYPEMMKTVRQKACFGGNRNITIMPTTLETKPGLLGAATLVIKEIFEHYRITIEK